MSDKTIEEKVGLLVENLGSRWNGGASILDRIVEAAGNKELSPYAACRQLGAEGLERLFSTEESRAELNRAWEEVSAYLAAETWFERAARGDGRLEVLQHHPVAYFCAEFGLEDWLPIYSGGLGILAGDVLKEASDLGLPLYGLGLFYRHGFFTQELDRTGFQTEAYPTLDPADLPMRRAVDAGGNEIVVTVPIDRRSVSAAVWQLEVGRTRLYLLDTDTPENERPEDRAITAHLYGGNEETRIQQELVLGIGGVRLLRRLGIDPSVYGMNEGHAAFLGIELLAERLERTDFDNALQRVRDHVVYTNHTVVAAGNDMFSHDLVRRYLEPYASQRGIGMERLLGLASPGSGDQFSMAILAFRLAGKANGVSRIHVGAIRAQWPEFQVEAVTNGVHLPTWLGPEVRALLDRYVPNWRSDSPSWEKLCTIPPAELWEAHVRQRRELLEFVRARVPGCRLDENALTIVWARRFADYKRAGLVANDMQRLERLMSNPYRPVQVLVAGKAHPRDEDSKRMMQWLLQQCSNDAAVAPHFIFVPNYSIEVAQQLTRGADIWLNTPRKPLEASGTSGMKSSDNGGLQLTVRDGWADEVNWWDVGWGIEGRDDGADAAQLYWFLEDSVIPTFYRRNESDVPEKWATMMKSTMGITLTQYSTRRMLLEYVDKLYLPLIEQQNAVL